MNVRGRAAGLLAGIVLSLALASTAHALTRPKVARDSNGQSVRLDGSLVLVEPDIELSLVTAGGLHEPRKDWSETARRLLPAALRRELAGRSLQLQPDFDIPDDLDPASTLGQIVRLNEAVALSITQYSQPGSQLATKRDPRGRARMDWSLGPGVATLREATGADYAMFVYVRDSYASGGRTALRVFGLLLGAAMGGVLDIGGGLQVGVATIVDLRSGQVVWYNLIANQSGDLRDEDGARKTVRQVLQKLPL
ncbi:hypothetical protein ACFOED_14110 [Vulcaniibacterium thermophilum]|uniref:Lipoprotein n=1 Tax=Vulcaniibacterium thermophilum TaxID=1169913 RepID=A0A918ZA34_9GAMM|nr:hypothetical protein [Vulcaniibacterium thermophilum]GHE43109.1 hypothetical protein GCM10007167_26170 [Vulcaniibacterium thermophilum]